jgi:hypothetical protein
MKGELEKAPRQLNYMWNVSNEMIVDAILITILSDHKSYEVFWIEDIFRNLGKDNEEELKTNMFLSDAIRKYKDILQITDFCKNDSKMLSVVHLLSVSLMKNTIKTLVEFYGRYIILNCMNIDRITPMYLWKLFSPVEHDEIIDEKLDILQPNIYAEKYILSIILRSLGYKHIPKSAIYCIFKPGPRQNKIYFSKMLQDYKYIYKIFSNWYQRGACASIIALIKLLRSVLFTDIRSVERCLYTSKLIQVMDTMIKEISTCFIYVHFHEIITIHTLSYQISKLTV